MIYAAAIRADATAAPALYAAMPPLYADAAIDAEGDAAARRCYFHDDI